jgi:hypothetical protein
LPTNGAIDVSRHYHDIFKDFIKVTIMDQGKAVVNNQKDGLFN